MKTLLSILFLCAAMPAFAQLNPSALDFRFNLSGYAGRYDTTLDGNVSMGQPTSVGMIDSITMKDSVLGFSDGLATDYGKFFTASWGQGLLQISVSVDTIDHMFRRIFVREIDTLDHLPVMDRIVIGTRSITLSDLPYTVTAPGTVSVNLTGAELAGHVYLPYAEHIDNYFRTTVTPTSSLDFVAASDSIANATVSVSITLPAASVDLSEQPLAQIWPNPVSSVLHVQNLQHGTETVLFDRLGREVARAHGESVEFDVSSVAPGAYFVRIGDRDVRAVVVERAR